MQETTNLIHRKTIQSVPHPPTNNPQQPILNQYPNPKITIITQQHLNAIPTIIILTPLPNIPRSIF